MIPPFKSPAGNELDHNSTTFNTLLAKPRVKSEHCIGILKGRFPFFRSIRMKFGNKIHLKNIIKYVRGGVILHNYMLQEQVDEEWLEVDQGDDLPPESSATTGHQANYTRRNEIFHYLSELQDTVIY